jgi:hypothetical protein
VLLAVDSDGIEFATASMAVEPIRTGSAVLELRAKFDASWEEPRVGRLSACHWL